MYKNNYLTKVIFRVDFATPEESLNKDLSRAVVEQCLEGYPIKDERDGEKRHVLIVHNAESPESAKTTINTELIKEWHFFDKNKEKELSLVSNCFVMSLKRYFSFDSVKTDFVRILSALCKSYPNIKLNRFGLRYIDQIDFPNEIVDRSQLVSFWSKYINVSLLGGLDFPGVLDNLARYMNSIEMNFDDHMLKFQYGIFNSDYPAKSKKISFLLDTDVYATGIFDVSDLPSMMESFHDRAKEVFENAITDGLRNKMNE